jgi:hypothetical protein
LPVVSFAAADFNAHGFCGGAKLFFGDDFHFFCFGSICVPNRWVATLPQARDLFVKLREGAGANLGEFAGSSPEGVSFPSSVAAPHALRTV